MVQRRVGRLVLVVGMLYSWMPDLFSDVKRDYKDGKIEQPCEDFVKLRERLHQDRNYRRE